MSSSVSYFFEPDRLIEGGGILKEGILSSFKGAGGLGVVGITRRSESVLVPVEMACMNDYFFIINYTSSSPLSSSNLRPYGLPLDYYPFF